MKNIIIYTIIFIGAMHVSQSWAGNGTMAKGSSSTTGRDIFYAIPSELECRACHDDLNRFPMLGDTNPNKHHLLISTDITEPTVPPGTILGDYYTCLTCHSSADSTFYFTRNCLECHSEESVTGAPSNQEINRHHQTESFINRDCSVCHDSGR